MLSLSELETPAPLVDLDVLGRNLDRMAQYAAEHELALRPHVKTHKSPFIGAEQIKRGAAGLTCATPRELEVMSEATGDLLLAYPPVGEPRLHRLMALPEHVALTVALDSVEAIEGLYQAARAANRRVRVYIELDFGMHRVGVPVVTQAVALAKLVRERAPLEYAGIAFYPGHVRQQVDAQRDALDLLNADLSSALETLDIEGVMPLVVSGGSTPTAWHSHEIAGLTEMRPGTYVYNDRTTAEIGACGWKDCALTVLATVVSTAVPGQAVIDAGAKALGREPLRADGADGFGVLQGRPEVVVTSMSEEHGILKLGASDWKPRVGELVRVIPNHVCIVVHLNDRVHGVRGDKVELSWPVAARGR
ncbi:MAG: alanine racemase [Gemmatimonadota bacterium]|nr:alanine racemase [Gemmatimonadota bacterium]